MGERDVRVEVLVERPAMERDGQQELDLALQVSAGVNDDDRPDQRLNLAIVLDRSGSMQGRKLETAKAATIDILKRIHEEDRLTVLAFDEEVAAVANPQISREEAAKRIAGIQSRGMTDLSKGWYLGLLELQTYSSPTHVNRLLLMSDGHATTGESKPSVLGAESQRARDEMDITTTTIGVGQSFQEDLLNALSQESGGNFWFIDEEGIEEIIRQEFEGSLSTAVERPRVELQLPPGASIARELNTLHKVGSTYRLRPIRWGETFAFGLRVVVDTDAFPDDEVAITAVLSDADRELGTAEVDIRFVDTDEYLATEPDLRVATVINKHLTAVSDEEMAGEMDDGTVTTAISMLESRSTVLKDLAAKLAGGEQGLIPWEQMDAEQQRMARQRREELDHELYELQHDIGENEVLLVVGQLIELMRTVGMEWRARDLLAYSRKMHMHRSSRNSSHRSRTAPGGMDDRLVRNLLADARREAEDMRGRDVDTFALELIIRSIDEQLARYA